MKSFLFGGVVSVVLALASSALADPAADRTTARELAEQAQDALEAKDYARARELYGRAYALAPVPTLALGQARADVGALRLVEAYETYNRIVREGAPADANDTLKRAVTDAKTELAALKPRLAGLVLRVSGVEGAIVTLDGESYPEAAVGVRRAINPGRHTVRASAKGAKPAERSFEIAEGGTSEVVLELTLELSSPGAPTPGAPRRDAAEKEPAGLSGLSIGGIVIGSLGVLSLGTAAVTGGMYWGARGDVDDHCDASLRCDADGIDAAARAETLGLVDTVTFFAGLGLAGVGTTLVLVGMPGAKETAYLTPGPTWLGLGVGGAL